MKLLAVDIGNSNLVLGLYDDQKLQKSWRIESRLGATADEYYIVIKALLHNFGNPDAAVFCSVVPEISRQLINCFKLLAIKSVLEVTNSSDLGMPILIDNPTELGADRLVNAYGAYLKHKKALIIVDFGTATTFDIVNDKGQYLGGIISCGIKLSLDALVENTALLPNIKLELPNKLIGKNTVESMQSGIIYGYGYMCEGLLKAIKKELGLNPIVIATGGLANIMHNISLNRMFEEKLTEEINIVDEDITLWSLLQIYQKLSNN